MTSQILDAAQFGKARGMTALIVRTRQINAMLGTGLAPWELAEMPEEWMTALEMWMDEYPKAVIWQAQVNESLARLRGQKVQ